MDENETATPTENTSIGEETTTPQVETSTSEPEQSSSEVTPEIAETPAVQETPELAPMDVAQPEAVEIAPNAGTGTTRDYRIQ